jgi:hypothetical protein
MAKPEVNIEVDESTGRWSVDSLPMILVPQHFFLNNHYAVESALGAAELERILRPAGYRSAYVWCQKEAEFHKLTGEQVFRHYLKRLSQRGWAQFHIEDFDQQRGTADIVVRNSAMIDPSHIRQKRKCCYMFAAWFEGAFDYVAKHEDQHSYEAKEVYCAAEGEHDHCRFAVRPPVGDRS